MNDFQRDHAWQLEIRDRMLAPGFYGEHSKEGRYVFVDKGRLATTLQKRFAVDTIAQSRNGEAACFEEKIVRWPKRDKRYDAYSLETRSCTVPGRESDGWMRYGQADYLLYCFQLQDGSLDCHLIDFPKLQAWFAPLEETFPTFGPLQHTINHSAGRVVPHERVRLAVPVKLFFIDVKDYPPP